MNIFYVITIFFMTILHILIYKKNNKENLLKWIGLTAILLICYNIFVCVILSFIKIKATLLNLSIINLIVICLFIFKIYKDNKIQKYELKKIDIIFVITVIILVSVITIKQYGIPIEPKSIITDSAVHYFSANEYYHNSMLLFEQNSEEMGSWNLNFLMPGAYINTGILFKVFSGIISETYFYQIYFMFDVCMFLLSGILMYILLSQNKKNEKGKILSCIFSLIYMLAYPLNSLLSGFSYLSIGLNIIIGIFIVMQSKLNKNYKMILMFLLDFGIIFSYNFFAPVVYLAIFWQIIVEAKKNKTKIFSKDNIINILYTLIIPGLFAVIYFIILQRLKYGLTSGIQYSKAIGIAGTIYENFIGNIIIFLVLSIIYIIYNIKNKKNNNNLITKMLILAIFFTITLYIGNVFEFVSDYYFYKYYYFLWILLIYGAFELIDKVLYKGKRAKILISILIILYSIFVVVAIIFKQSLLFFDIYNVNFKEIASDWSVLKIDELKVLEYYNENIKKVDFDDNTFFYVTPYGQGRSSWIYAITKNPYSLIDMLYGEPTDNLECYMENSKKYGIIFAQDYAGDYNNIDNEVQKNNIKILFKNEAGIVLEKM